MQLLLLVAAPVLIFGQALGGLAAWFHRHGSLGLHLHLSAAESKHAELQQRHEWHEAEHRHEDFADHAHGDEPLPAGLFLELPEILATKAATHGGYWIASLSLLALMPAPSWECARVESSRRLACWRFGWPPEAVPRSGIAGLLCSNHAILI